jgi:class 3 adenylate cyclase
MNDKGISVILVFGLPPLGHSDDALRAIEAAWAVRRIHKSNDITASIGVATGRVFCGECGGDTRREYSILGQTINLSARLMVVAEDEVLCDLVTSTSIDRRITFSALGNVQLKGWTQPVPGYRPEGAGLAAAKDPRANHRKRRRARNLRQSAPKPAEWRRTICPGSRRGRYRQIEASCGPDRKSQVERL